MLNWNNIFYLGEKMFHLSTVPLRESKEECMFKECKIRKLRKESKEKEGRWK